MVGVETGKRKRGPFMALLVMLMILLHTSDCGATSSIINDNATSPYHARMDEPDWMFDSEISRMLATKRPVTDGTKNRDEKAVSPCGRGQQYESCLPQSNEANRPETCSPYKRNC